MNDHTELLLCLSSSSIEWGVCWRGDHHHCGMGLFGSVLPFASLAITLSSVSMFLTPLTPAGGQETTLSVTAAVEMLCLVSIGMAMCRDGKNAAPRCWISKNPPADARLVRRNLLPHLRETRGRLQQWRQMNYLETTDASVSLLKNNLIF